MFGLFTKPVIVVAPVVGVSPTACRPVLPLLGLATRWLCGTILEEVVRRFLQTDLASILGVVLFEVIGFATPFACDASADSFL